MHVARYLGRKTALLFVGYPLGRITEPAERHFPLSYMKNIVTF